MDLVLRAERVVIEAKRPGRADDPYAPGTGSKDGESAFDQLTRCVEGELDNEVGRLKFYGHAPWRGIVCNGRSWHAWEWPVESGSYDQPRHLSSNGFGEGQGTELAAWLRQVCEHGSGLAVVPNGFHDLLFAPHLKSLRSLHTEVVAGHDREAKRVRDTQYKLWYDLLAGADMTPPEAEASRLFVSHTFLVVAARVVADALNDPTPGALSHPSGSDRF